MSIENLTYYNLLLSIRLRRGRAIWIAKAVDQLSCELGMCLQDDCGREDHSKNNPIEK